MILDMVMNLCPFCGHQLDKELRDGIADCPHCHRVFDSCKYNQLLSASWVLRKNPQTGLDKLIFLTKLSAGDALFVYTFIADNLYTHDEFQAYLKSLGVSNKVIG